MPENKKTENKKTENKQVPKPKVDLKAQNKKLVEENKKLDENVRNLINQINELKLSNAQAASSFEEKAKGFQSKAQIEIDKVKQELIEKAEFENSEFKKYGLQKTFENIIEPLINIEVAVKSGKNQGPEIQAYVMGFEMLMNQLQSELEEAGLKKVTPKVGDEFDPEIHQATSTEEGETNKIIKVIKPGFKLYERVIKPAAVIIGK